GDGELATVTSTDGTGAAGLSMGPQAPRARRPASAATRMVLWIREVTIGDAMPMWTHAQSVAGPVRNVRSVRVRHLPSALPNVSHPFGSPVWYPCVHHFSRSADEPWVNVPLLTSSPSCVRSR